jgi:hypothetical protein
MFFTDCNQKNNDNDHVKKLTLSDLNVDHWLYQAYIKLHLTVLSGLYSQLVFLIQ